MKLEKLLQAKLNGELKTNDTDSLEDYRLQEEVNELMLDERVDLTSYGKHELTLLVFNTDSMYQLTLEPNYRSLLNYIEDNYIYSREQFNTLLKRLKVR